MKKVKFEEENESSSTSESELFISEELILEILIRLDPKTLTRSKAVCRNWLSWICDQSFINNFIRRTKSLPPSINGIVCRYGGYGGEAYFISTSDSDDRVIEDNVRSFLGEDNILGFLTAETQGNVVLVDSNNGVLLCARKPNYELIWSPNSELTWNPSCYFVCNHVTKQWVELPESNYFEYTESALLHCYNVDVEGAFAQKTECKVYCFRKKRPYQLEVEIYSSETGKWEECIDIHYVWYVKEFNSLTLLNKCAYWLQEDCKVAVCDLEAETVRVIAPSIMHMFSPKWALHVGVSAGSLYFVDRSQEYFFVWVLGVEGQLCWHQNIEIRQLEQVTGSGVVFKFLGFDPVSYKLLLVGIGPEYATLVCLDDNGLVFSKAMNKSFFCNCDLKVFPYSLPAWPTCIPFIKQN